MQSPIRDCHLLYYVKSLGNLKTLLIFDVVKDSIIPPKRHVCS